MEMWRSFTVTLLIGFAVAVTLVVSSNWSGIQAYWLAHPDIQAAIIGAVATVASGTLGVLAIIWQLKRQASVAIRQNAHNQALALKLEIYRDLSQKYAAAIQAEMEFIGFCDSFLSDVQQYEIMQEVGINSDPPRHRSSELMNLDVAAQEAMGSIISIIERYQIVDSRIDIFREAFAFANHERGTHFDKYFLCFLKVMPLPVDDGVLFPWSPPGADQLATVEELTVALRRAVDRRVCWIIDFQAEMQQLLLGDMFPGNMVTRRSAPDPEFFTIRLDQTGSILERLSGTEWGKRRLVLEKEAQAKFH